VDPVTALRRAHPGWQIQIEAGVWVAVNRPAQNSQHIIVGPSYEELKGKLESEDQ
jgi:hypothetical protein